MPDWPANLTRRVEALTWRALAAGPSRARIWTRDPMSLRSAARVRRKGAVGRAGTLIQWAVPSDRRHARAGRPPGRLRAARSVGGLALSQLEGLARQIGALIPDHPVGRSRFHGRRGAGLSDLYWHRLHRHLRQRARTRAIDRRGSGGGAIVGVSVPALAAAAGPSAGAESGSVTSPGAPSPATSGVGSGAASGVWLRDARVGCACLGLRRQQGRGRGGRGGDGRCVLDDLGAGRIGCKRRRLDRRLGLSRRRRFNRRGLTRHLGLGCGLGLCLRGCRLGRGRLRRGRLGLGRASGRGLGSLPVSRPPGSQLVPPAPRWSAPPRSEQARRGRARGRAQARRGSPDRWAPPGPRSPPGSPASGSPDRAANTYTNPIKVTAATSQTGRLPLTPPRSRLRPGLGCFIVSLLLTAF